MAAIEFDSVSITYEGTDRPVRALDSFSLSIADGEPVAVIGPSGCGKSTMLLLAAGLLGTADGKAAVRGRVSVGGAELAGIRIQTALILQDYGLLPWKSVMHNAGLGLEIRGVAKAQRERLVSAALDRVGLAEFRRSYPGELSGGMRQRLALARAVALDADVLLMDEPLSALDALTREDLQGVLLELWRARRHAQVLVTHSIEEAVFLGRRIVVMTPRPGRVAAVIENPEMGDEGYRASGGFYERCAEVRALLASEGALRSGESGVLAAGGPSSPDVGGR